MSLSNAFACSVGESAAAELQQIFGPYCTRVCVAGSVRRRSLIVHDIELVVVPKIETITVRVGLFEEENTPVDRLEQFCELIGRKDHHLLCRPNAAPGHRAPAWGDRYKKLLFHHMGRWRPVDLWITSAERFGSTLAIRTGDKDFSHRLVMPRIHGGAMPEKFRQANGQLERVGGVLNGELVWVPVPTPEESDFFAALGLPVLRPQLRTDKNLIQLLKECQVHG